MTIDDAIRDALGHVGDLAPDPLRIQAGLDARARAYRQRRALITAVAAAAGVTAVGGPAVLLSRGYRHQAPQLPSTYSASPSPSAVNRTIPMRYRPGWLPAGIGEVGRFVGADFSHSSDQLRRWERAGGPASVDLRVGTPESIDVSALHPATVNGQPGWERTEYGVTLLTWDIEPGVRIQVGVSSDSPTLPMAQRIAASVVPDDVAVLEVPLTFGWLPGGMDKGGGAVISLWQHSWVAQISASDGRQSGGNPTGTLLAAQLGTPEDLVPKYPVRPTPSATARGLPVRYLTDSMIVVELPDGLALRVNTLGPPMTPEVLVRIASGITVGPVPDTSWIGH